MKVYDYPRTTIILRGVSYDQAEAITSAASEFKGKFAVEVTRNTKEVFKIVKNLKEKIPNNIYIGVGTVRNLEDVQKSIEADADFILGPHIFTKEMISLAKNNDLLTIPSAMTPSEIHDMFSKGADIVKVFPAAVVTPRFFKDVQAPLGTLPLMAVGGVTRRNANDFFGNNASYVGIGSSMFPKEVLETLNSKELFKILDNYIAHVDKNFS